MFIPISELIQQFILKKNTELKNAWSFLITERNSSIAILGDIIILKHSGLLSRIAQGDNTLVFLKISRTKTNSKFDILGR